MSKTTDRIMADAADRARCYEGDAAIIAQYADGAGQWTVTRSGSALVIATPNGEYLAYTLTRAREYDARLEPEFKLTERFGACDDLVWIDGEAWTLEGGEEL